MASEGDATKDIHALKGLMGRKPIAQKGGHIADQILKLLIYGGQQRRGALI